MFPLGMELNVCVCAFGLMLRDGSVIVIVVRFASVSHAITDVSPHVRVRAGSCSMTILYRRKMLEA